MPRRANGEGSIFQRKDGLWAGEAFVLLPNGGRSRRTVYGRTRAQVHAQVMNLVAQTQRGVVAPNAKLTVGQYLDAWLREVARRTVRPRTYQNYELMVRRHLVPDLGRRRLDQLAAADVRRLLNAKTDEGFAPATVRHIHATLRAALEQAVRDDLLQRNVARLVRGPKVSQEPIRPLDVGEARLLLKTAQRDRLYALWAVGLGVGLRKGEALGLAWEHVDLDDGWLRVSLSLQRIDGRLRLDEPKSRRSRRTVPLPPMCVEALRAHARRQADERRSAGDYWTDSGLVFTTTIGTPIDPRNVNRWFAALCERAGVRRIRPHDMRHTCASLLLAQGVSPRVVMEILGHSQISVTMNLYAHVLPGMNEEAANLMQDALVGRVAVPVAVVGADDSPRSGGAGKETPGQVRRARRDSNPQPSDPYMTGRGYPGATATTAQYSGRGQPRRGNDRRRPQRHPVATLWFSIRFSPRATPGPSRRIADSTRSCGSRR
ncbi:MAG: tyrosine-type recombinase/integrase [Acidimicrobiales bacterium]